MPHHRHDEHYQPSDDSHEHYLNEFDGDNDYDKFYELIKHLKQFHGYRVGDEFEFYNRRAEEDEPYNLVDGPTLNDLAELEPGDTRLDSPHSGSTE